MKWNTAGIAIIIIAALVCFSCLTILTVAQPSVAGAGSTFPILLTVEIDPEGGAGLNPQYGIIGLLVPVYSSINTVSVRSFSTSGVIVHSCVSLPPGSSDYQPGEGTDDWYAELNSTYPPPPLMGWRVFETGYRYPVLSSTENKMVYASISLQNTPIGWYGLRYFVSTAGLTVEMGFITEPHTLQVVSSTAVRDEHEAGISFTLRQNYPNPFNGTTWIPISLPKAGRTSLIVYNTLGRKVAVVFDAVLGKGDHALRFTATGIPSGIYYYVLRQNDMVETKRMAYIE